MYAAQDVLRVPLKKKSKSQKLTEKLVDTRNQAIFRFCWTTMATSEQDKTGCCLECSSHKQCLDTVLKTASGFLSFGNMSFMNLC